MENRMVPMPLYHAYLPLMAYVLFYFRQQHRPPELPQLRQQIDQLWQQGERQLCAGGIEKEILSRIQFPVAAWVDEIILTSEQELREEWQGCTLQQRLFHTTNAGQLFYDDLFRLEDNDGEDEIRQVYALCLNIGFIGAYFHPEDEPARQQARLKAGIVDQGVVPDEIKYLFPAAYQTLQSSRPQTFRLRYLKRFFFFLLPPAVVVVLWAFYQWSLNQQLQHYFSPIVTG